MKKMLIIALAIVVVNAGKVTWGANGKPQIEEPTHPVFGCDQGGIHFDNGDIVIEDSNSTCTAWTSL